MTALQRRFDQDLEAALAGDRPARLGLAVSGGGDSIAMLHLAADWAARAGVGLAVASVDHRLRAAAADEAAGVIRAAAALNLMGDVLAWTGWDGRGNLMAAARAARYRLLADWAAARGISHIALGHTADDQAETVLIEIARRAGPRGQSGMAARRQSGGVVWLRPMLGIARDDLRDWLRARGTPWVDDPSNDDPRFARIRARQVLAGQPGATQALTDLAAQARDRLRALDAAAGAAAGMIALERGEMRLPLTDFAALDPAVARHLIGAALIWLAGPGPAPRGRALDHLMDRIARAEGGPLHGVMTTLRRGDLILTRDATCQPGPVAVLPGQALIWDRLWRVTPPVAGQIAPLGAAGLSHLHDPRATGLSHAALRASPALWHGGRPIAAAFPLRGNPPLLPAEWLGDRDDFVRTSFAH
ncbi:tRNA lysidine(34) synthetase TilS [Paracoccus sp. p3-h83]|uniref:tRNA lysidine(34) synthetase TilS n=1 Tax=Paracoccus sp. p3-h83 TaxID=3342805 RepID=UPI0035B6C65B